MAYQLREVDGLGAAEVLHYLNRQEPSFPVLERHHLDRGYWWLAETENKSIVGFAGMVPMAPFDWLGVGYCKRAYVSPAHRGCGIQAQFLKVREERAAVLGWRQLVAECAGDNVPSANNFLRSGFERCYPEQPWGAAGSIYFSKKLW